MRGRFITLEGGEGAGKTTQIKHLISFLEKQSIEVVATREVGGCPSAEEIRELWLSKPKDYWDPMSEVFLIMAARREHLSHVILPALEQGKWVVSDRFVDSTRIYQGFAMGLGLDRIDIIYSQVAGDFWPDMTLYLDLPVAEGVKRLAGRGGQDDRYQQQEIAFHQKLRDGFLVLAEKEKDRFVVVNALQDEQAVSKDIEKAVGRLTNKEQDI